MLSYVVRRILLMIPTLLVVSIVVFGIILLPPGDYLTMYADQLQRDTLSGERPSEEMLEQLKQRYGLGQPVYVQYTKWISGILLRNDWGESMYFGQPVKEVIGDRIWLTFVLSFSTMIFSWAIAIPIGVYSATHQYSLVDYAVTAFNFIGSGIPAFMLALVLMWWAMTKLRMSVGGLFSPEFIRAPWSLAKFVDLLKHIWQPMLVLAVGSTAGSIRITRANLLDQLNMPYVQTARAKGLTERRLLWKYPVRVALNPFFSTAGWSLAGLISGSTIVSIVLSLQTTGPMLYQALISQDMYLAGSFVLLLSVLTIIGTLLSDLLLAWADPRIRIEGGGS